MKEHMMVKVEGLPEPVEFSKITQEELLSRAQAELSDILAGVGAGVQATQALTRTLFNAMQIPNLIKPGESASVRGFGTFNWHVSNPRKQSFNPRTKQIEDTNAVPSLRLKFEASGNNRYKVVS